MGSCESAAPPLESRNARKQQAGLAMSDEFMLDTDDLERRMNGAIASLRTEFASLRTGAW